MPRTIDEGFNDFLSQLTPSATESQAAKSHRASIEQCLSSNFGLDRFARIGSFGNGTSISGYSDVDYLACMPRDELSNVSSYSLTKVRNALDERFPNTGVRVNCPAIVVPFGNTASEATEIVIADHLWNDDDFGIYDIPNCNDGWMRVGPDKHNDYVRQIDNKLSNKVKPLIRFIKAWKYYQNVPISSFYLELRVAKYSQGEGSILYYIDLCRIFRLLYDVALADMQDPMGVSGYIKACKTDSQYETALSKLKTALIRAEKAYEAIQAEKISDAFDCLRLLFNYQFPTYYY